MVFALKATHKDKKTQEGTHHSGVGFLEYFIINHSLERETGIRGKVVFRVPFVVSITTILQHSMPVCRHNKSTEFLFNLTHSLSCTI